MDDYIQYVKQEAAASATRAISRAVAVTIYGVACVYVLTTILSGALPKVSAILPLGSNAVDGQDEGGNDLLWWSMGVKWHVDDGNSFDGKDDEKRPYTATLQQYGER